MMKEEILPYVYRNIIVFSLTIATDNIPGAAGWITIKVFCLFVILTGENWSNPVSGEI